MLCHDCAIYRYEFISGNISLQDFHNSGINMKNSFRMRRWALQARYRMHRFFQKIISQCQSISIRKSKLLFSSGVETDLYELNWYSNILFSESKREQLGNQAVRWLKHINNNSRERKKRHWSLLEMNKYCRTWKIQHSRIYLSWSMHDRASVFPKVWTVAITLLRRLFIM